jgi:hypothetical protein
MADPLMSMVDRCATTGCTCSLALQGMASHGMHL